MVFRRKLKRTVVEHPTTILVSGEGTWTPDRADMSRLLYHLSYAAILYAICITGATIQMNQLAVKGFHHYLFQSLR